MKRPMLLLLLACTAGWLEGCANNKPPEQVQQELVVDKHVQPMSRNEVILAVQECQTSGLRAVMLYAKRKVNGYTTDIVVEVTCAPRY